MKSGIELIAEERQRQIEQEGYTAEHDDGHCNDELAYAAMYYAMPDKVTDVTMGGGCAIAIKPELFFYKTGWSTCFASRDNKVRMRQLAIAGAFIAAEIDRLQRQEREG